MADLSLVMQPKFLRAVQEGEGRRLGSAKGRQYDFRIISASNRNLHEQVRLARFREDLFFRLVAVTIHLPALRERREDIVPLSLAFLDDVCKRFKRPVAGFSPAVLDLFLDYQWPGNIRQLRREVERLVALTPAGEYVLPDKCSRELHAPGGVSASAADAGAGGSCSIPDQTREMEMSLISRALQTTRGNKLKTAALLGITRQGLYKKMRRYGLK